MSQNIDNMYSLKEIGEIFGVPYRTVYYWIKTHKIKAWQGINRFNINEWYISKSDWLDVPAFIRNRYHIKKRG